MSRRRSSAVNSSIFSVGQPRFSRSVSGRPASVETISRTFSGMPGGSQTKSGAPSRSSSWFNASMTNTNRPRAAAMCSALATVARRASAPSGISTSIPNRSCNSPRIRRSMAAQSALSAVAPTKCSSTCSAGCDCRYRSAQLANSADLPNLDSPNTTSGRPSPETCASMRSKYSCRPM